MVDEHRHRPRHHPRHLEHLLEDVAAGIGDVDDDDVGIELGEAPDQARRGRDDRDVDDPGVAQAVDEDRGADAVVVDDGDADCGLGHSLGVLTPERRFIVPRSKFRAHRGHRARPSESAGSSGGGREEVAPILPQSPPALPLERSDRHRVLPERCQRKLAHEHTRNKRRETRDRHGGSGQRGFAACTSQAVRSASRLIWASTRALFSLTTHRAIGSQ